MHDRENDNRATYVRDESVLNVKPADKSENSVILFFVDQILQHVEGTACRK